VSLIRFPILKYRDVRIVEKTYDGSHRSTGKESIASWLHVLVAVRGLERCGQYRKRGKTGE
jgi:hypothetical protein